MKNTVSRIYRFLTQDDLRLLEEMSLRVTYEPDEVILREGSQKQCLYILRSGSARVEKDHRGESITVDRLSPGEFIGVMSFLDDSPMSATIAAAEKVEIDYLDGLTLHALLSSVPGFSSRFYMSLAVIMAERLREMMERVMPPFNKPS
ncbi:MAG: cyclic nucleotide-binding domain-containing protein [Magnetococcales bacterium]|nr:cyclic nucleotide-binding domain-containing protein [Magnetococcales bacterium]